VDLMYEELVKRCKALRDYNGLVSDEMIQECWDCVSEAADAIEELQKTLDAVNDAHNEGYDVGYWAGRRDYKPKWIPVAEEPTLKVGDDGYNGYLVFANGYYEVADYTTDKFDNVPYFHVDGKHEPDVTHYMPLPTPPKEEA